MKRGELLQAVYDRLYREYGECVCPLVHRNVFELAVAVMLSAQCRDDRVNAVTPELFRRFTSASELAAADVSEVEEIIRTLGLAHAKAKNLVGMARKVDGDFGGVVPHAMEDLLTLPGIGRKSANVILGNGFGIPGFPVDTHVKRLLNRIGVAVSDSPGKLEAIVTAVLPDRYWTDFSHLLITHGRRVCSARRPDCSGCAIAPLCRRKGVRK